MHVGTVKVHAWLNQLKVYLCETILQDFQQGFSNSPIYNPTAAALV